MRLQVVASAGNPSAHVLCEEKVPLLKERSEVKRCAQYRFLAPEEEVVRLVSRWDMEEGYVGRICLKTKDEVLTVQAVILTLAPSSGGHAKFHFHLFTELD